MVCNRDYADLIFSIFCSDFPVEMHHHVPSSSQTLPEQNSDALRRVSD